MHKEHEGRERPLPMVLEACFEEDAPAIVRALQEDKLAYQRENSASAP